MSANEHPWVQAMDLSRLAAWMDGQGLGSGAIDDVTILSGGTQNLLLRLRHAGRYSVLRRPAVQARPEAGLTIVREARVLQALASTTLPHARLIAACANPQVLGAPFYLMEPVAGFNPSGTPLPALHAADPALRRRMGMAMVDALITLGEIDPQAVGLMGPSVGALGDFGRPEGFLQRQVQRWRRQLDACSAHATWPGPDGLPGVAAVGNWLDLHVPEPTRPGLLHGDFHLSNVMFRHDGPEIAAVIDWELATIGDPLLDLGWLIATWPDATGQGAGTIHVTPWQGFPGVDALIERYASCSPRSLSALSWYVTLARYKLGILLECSHARACAGWSDADVGQRHHASAQRLLCDALADIESSG